jgi:DNA-binding transcriptional regulator YhcF (GntR family)
VNNQNEVNITLRAVTNAFKPLHHVAVEPTKEAGRFVIHVAGKAVPLRVITRASGYPRDVRAAVWGGEAQRRADEALLVYAPALSATSREWLREEGVGYLDSQQNLFLIADGVYLYCESGLKPEKSQGGVDSQIFRGRATQVLQALLHSRERTWHVTDLAEEAGVAPGTALRVCEKLEKMLIVEREGRGPSCVRHLTRPAALLDIWAQNHRLDQYEIRHYYRRMPDADTLTRTIGSAVEAQGGTYAATLSAGAMHRAPFLSELGQTSILVPADMDLDQLALDARLEPVDQGYNVLLLATRNRGPLMYRQREGDLWVANDVQIYIDLYASPGRGRQQADHLRRERIGI